MPSRGRDKMFSTFLTDVLQDLLKEFFPKFAYWLFYSEMALALLLGILFCFAWPVGTLAGLGLHPVPKTPS